MAKSFQERLRRAKNFIGRETELAFFRELLDQDEPGYLILLVYGLSGVGKTWLLNRWETQAREKHFAVARVNEDQSSVEQILKKFRDDFNKQGFNFKEFDKSYQKFRQLKVAAEKALSQWEEKRDEDISRTAGRITGRSISVIARFFSPSREALELVGGREKVEQAFAEGFSYLRKWSKDQQDREFLEDPLSHLTHGFIKDLNQVCEEKRVVLFFDAYEYLSPFSDKWLCKTFLQEELSAQIMFIFAGTKPFSPLWLDYQPLCKQMLLDVFTEEETRTYLISQGIKDPRVIANILEFSGSRLPVYLAMLTTQPGIADQDLSAPTTSVVERFLKWIPQEELDKRRAAIYSAFPRYFNKDLMLFMIGKDDASTWSGEELFNWLQTLPFISQKKKGWSYHKLVRDQILQYKYRESIQEYKELHERALAYYRQNAEAEALAEELYHTLCTDSEKGIQFGLAGLFRVRIQGESVEDWIMQVEDVVQQVEKEKLRDSRLSRKWKEHLQLIFQKDPKSVRILMQLGEDETLAPLVKTEVYITLGILLFYLQRYEDAVQTLQRVLEIDPENARAWTAMGVAYFGVGRDEDAVQAFQRVREIDPEHTGITIGMYLGQEWDENPVQALQKEREKLALLKNSLAVQIGNKSTEEKPQTAKSILNQIKEFISKPDSKEFISK